MDTLTDIQRNILIASVIADGEITKIHKNSRRKNHSYREHYGKDQENYRKWKISFFNGLLYLTPMSNTVHSKSLPLFTKLYPYFYKPNGVKIMPIPLFSCHLIHGRWIFMYFNKNKSPKEINLFDPTYLFISSVLSKR